MPADPQREVMLERLLRNAVDSLREEHREKLRHARVYWEDHDRKACGVCRFVADPFAALSPSPGAGPAKKGRTYGEPGSGGWGPGMVGCAECCNGDRCDDASHVDRRSCTHCNGTGQVPAPPEPPRCAAIQPSFDRACVLPAGHPGWHHGAPLPANLNGPASTPAWPAEPPASGQEEPVTTPLAGEPAPCRLCGHGMRDNLHGIDQNDFSGGVHTGRCTYCRVCNPRLPAPPAEEPKEAPACATCHHAKEDHREGRWACQKCGGCVQCLFYQPRKPAAPPTPPGKEQVSEETLDRLERLQPRDVGTGDVRSIRQIIGYLRRLRLRVGELEREKDTLTSQRDTAKAYNNCGAATEDPDACRTGMIWCRWHALQMSDRQAQRAEAAESQVASLQGELEQARETKAALESRCYEGYPSASDGIFDWVDGLASKLEEARRIIEGLSTFSGAEVAPGPAIPRWEAVTSAADHFLRDSSPPSKPCPTTSSRDSVPGHEFVRHSGYDRECTLYQRCHATPFCGKTAAEHPGEAKETSEAAE